MLITFLVPSRSQGIETMWYICHTLSNGMEGDMTEALCPYLTVSRTPL